MIKPANYTAACIADLQHTANFFQEIKEVDDATIIAGLAESLENAQKFVIPNFDLQKPAPPYRQLSPKLPAANVALEYTVQRLTKASANPNLVQEKRIVLATDYAHDPLMENSSFTESGVLMAAFYYSLGHKTWACAQAMLFIPYDQTQPLVVDPDLATGTSEDHHKVKSSLVIPFNFVLKQLQSDSNNVSEVAMHAIGSDVQVLLQFIQAWQAPNVEIASLGNPKSNVRQNMKRLKDLPWYPYHILSYGQNFGYHEMVPPWPRNAEQKYLWT